MRSNFRAFIFATCLLAMAIGKDMKNQSVFIPSNEWQPVAKGTPVPRGLHIRHNFQTGLTEAKLMDPEEMKRNTDNDHSSKNELTEYFDHTQGVPEDDDAVGQPTLVRDAKYLKLSGRELRDKVKRIHMKEQQLPQESDADTPSDDERDDKFHSFSKLKKEFKKKDVNISNDADLMSAFIDRFHLHKDAIVNGKLSVKDIEDISDTLSNLEYIVHHIDNGESFVYLGGLTKVIYPCLNSTNNELKAEALRVLGSCVQLNPKVQQAALELGLVQMILTLITTTMSMNVRANSMYALGALVRQSPASQKILVDHGGLNIFAEILTGGQMETQRKVLNLINDLIMERVNHEDIQESEGLSERMREYSVIDLERKLTEEMYCKSLGSLMVAHIQYQIKEQFSLQFHDFLELIYESMITAGEICKEEFRSRKEVFLPALNQMLVFYHSLDKKLFPDEDDLFRHLVLLMEKLRRTVFEWSKDEL